jgi:hypothetical protein
MQQRMRTNKTHIFKIVGRDSSVGTATFYGLDGPKIESNWRWHFPHQSRTALGLHDGYWVSFPGAKRPARGVNHPPPSSAEVNER